MVDVWLLGPLGGALSIQLKPLLLRPLAKRRASPWTRWAARLVGHPVESAEATRAGLVLLAVYGAGWGALYTLWDQAWAPVAESFVLQGILLGVVVFAVSSVVVAFWPDLRRRIDRRLWVGLLLTDLLFGATVGLLFLIWGPFPAG